MRVAIVSVPFTELEVPSLAAGTLEAYLHQSVPQHEYVASLPYLHFAEVVGRPLYQLMASDFVLGRALFGLHLYPEKRDDVRAYVLRRIPAYLDLLDHTAHSLLMDVLMDRRPDGSEGSEGPEAPDDPHRLRELYRGVAPLDAELAEGDRGFFEYLSRTTDQFVEQAAEDLVDRADTCIFVLGASAGASYLEASLFPALAIARAMKQRRADVTVMLAGFGGMSYGLAQPLLDEYPFLDHVVEGAIENQVAARLRSQDGAADPTPAAPAADFDLDQALAPTFHTFARWAEESEVIPRWSIPIESARGCWWDRVARRDDPFATCAFCNRHGLAYQERRPEDVAQEMATQAGRYGNHRFMFVDSLVRAREVDALAAEIERQGVPLSFTQHARAQISPYEILLLWEAGMGSVQIGIEGLSSSFLQRIGKGTKTIQNLQAMKTLYELNIGNVACNLLIDFPGATDDEVAETAHNIRTYAVAYQPLEASPFWLIRTTTVERHPESFGIENLRNRDGYKAFLPDDVWSRLPLPLMDFDVSGPNADWQPVRDALEAWENLHRKTRSNVHGPAYHDRGLLSYSDHGSSMEIVDKRSGFSVITLQKPWRDVYLHSMTIRRRSDLERFFHGTYSPDQLDEILGQLDEANLIFREADRVLALATAKLPHKAAARIRAAHALDEADRTEGHLRVLPSHTGLDLETLDRGGATT